MTVKNFYFSQIADLMVEGAGIHGSYSLSLTVNEENTDAGKKIRVSATGKSNAVKATGSGKLLFWCKITNNINTERYILEKVKGESCVIGIDDILVGSVDFTLKKSPKVPELVIEFGYFYDAGYIGSVPPFPASCKRSIKLTDFRR